MSIKEESLAYHLNPHPGKIGITVTKPITNQRELTLAYSPGVAEPVIEIDKNPEDAYKYTAKGNLVGVISNGTAILGLGNLGALASKPVMEGKAALFKILADVDAFDIEVDETDPVKFIEIVKAISPTFGAINLEDIKAPECFAIEQGLQDIGIPVIHDDQHGTAIVIAAGLINACELQGITISEAKIVMYGAGAAAIASINLLCELGFARDNIITLDSKGVINSKRTDLNKFKQGLVNDKADTIAQAMHEANVLIELSGAQIAQGEELLRSMAKNPIAFMLSNPNPGIPVATIEAVRPDAIIATGRSDYANQINNSLCFPYLFRGALAARAKQMSLQMKIAAVHAIRELAKAEIPDYIKSEYNLAPDEKYGPSYIIPKTTDKRLKQLVSDAVANAAN